MTRGAQVHEGGDDGEAAAAMREAQSRRETRPAFDDRRKERIRWRARRGMLENDLVLASFLDRHGDSLTDEDIEKLDSLLDMTDCELWELLAGRGTPDPALAALVARVRAP